MTPDEVLRHLITTLDDWAAQLAAAEQDADPRTAVEHVRRNIEQASMVLNRLSRRNTPNAP